MAYLVNEEWIVLLNPKWIVLLNPKWIVPLMLSCFIWLALNERDSTRKAEKRARRAGMEFSILKTFG
jgi:hypothetical protein